MTKSWKKRENQKTNEHKEKDEKLYKAAIHEKWEEVESLVENGATGDYIYLSGGTGYYWVLLYAKEGNDQKAIYLLEILNKKWKNIEEKEWAVQMAMGNYYYAAQVINWTYPTGIKIIKNSKFPIYSILTMMGEDDWKKTYTNEILEHLKSNLKSKIKNDFDFIKQKGLTNKGRIKNYSFDFYKTF